jgi:hypothetical protein
MINMERLETEFQQLFAEYGTDDYVDWGFNIRQKTWGYHRIRWYYDGYSIHGSKVEPVVYWGA